MPRFKFALSPDYIRVESQDATNKTETAEPVSGATSLVYDRKGLFFAAVWTKRGRTERYRFTSRERAESWAAKQLTNLRARAERAEQEKEAKRNFKTTLKVGDILVSTWGYEQTNVDYYQVIRVVGRVTVEIRKIAQKLVKETGHMSEQVAPDPDNFIGTDSRKCRVSVHGYVSLGSSYKSARKWEGTPNFQSHYA